jgi:hypothetical protein
MLVVAKSTHKQINWVKITVYGSIADFGDLLIKKLGSAPTRESVTLA